MSSTSDSSPFFQIYHSYLFNIYYLNFIFLLTFLNYLFFIDFFCTYFQLFLIKSFKPEFFKSLIIEFNFANGFGLYFADIADLQKLLLLCSLL